MKEEYGKGQKMKKGGMSKEAEALVYEISLRVRLFMASMKVRRKVADLSERESLLLELIGMRDNMSISEIAKLYPTVSGTTISTTITKLWKERKLVDKKILPDNQRVTIVSLTKEGRKLYTEIKEAQVLVYQTIAESFGLKSDQYDAFKSFVTKAIQYFDRELGLEPKGG
jgi:DNA-binding MarR family transcriptional regulator